MIGAHVRLQRNQKQAVGARLQARSPTAPAALSERGCRGARGSLQARSPTAPAALSERGYSGVPSL
jgi:hypothetical protein